MRMLELTNLEIADLCRELALLLHAGVRLDDGLYLLAGEERDSTRRDLMTQLAHTVEAGAFLHQAFEEAGCCPVYVTGLLQVGERVGRTEEALQALCRYYEEREQTERRVRSALAYPAILLMLMLVVIVVLLSRVLPVFNEIYASLGGQLTGVAGGLLLLGQALNRAMPVLCAVLAAVLLFLAAFSLHGGFRRRILGFWRGRFGDRGVSRKLNDAHFAEALSMGYSSGLPLEEAVDLAAKLMCDIPQAVLRCRTCRERLEQGDDLAHALGETGLLSAANCRLLALGLRGGSADGVLREIARRMAEEAQLALESKVAKIEPALVLVTSALVGAILLSVMLPLMNIMTAIG